MSIRHIKIFLAVCENGYSITKAAKALYMTQPAVSLAVKELETYYGVALFERLSRQLFITEAGKQMMEYAIHMISLMDNMEKGLKDWDAVGILRVGSSITIGSQFMPYYISTYQDRYPKMDVRVSVNSSEILEKLIHENHLDLAFVEGPVHSSDLHVEEYMEDSLSAVCSANGPFHSGEHVSVEEFVNQRFLLREKGSGTREVFDAAMQNVKTSVVPVWEATSTTALVNAVIQGLGVAVLPSRMIAGPVQRGQLSVFQVEGMKFDRKFLIVYHKNKFLTKSAKALIDLCKNYEFDSQMLSYDGLYE